VARKASGREGKQEASPRTVANSRSGGPKSTGKAAGSPTVKQVGGRTARANPLASAGPLGGTRAGAGRGQRPVSAGNRAGRGAGFSGNRNCAFSRDRSAGGRGGRR
jgi:hypothetical protein